jgi:hypothetical protein
MGIVCECREESVVCPLEALASGLYMTASLKHVEHGQADLSDAKQGFFISCLYYLENIVEH